jgi:hypothetical protein
MKSTGMAYWGMVGIEHGKINKRKEVLMTRFVYSSAFHFYLYAY